MKNEFAQHQVESIQSIQQVQSFLDELDERSLLLFDIDGVLSIPAEASLHPSIFKKHELLVQSLIAHFDREQRHIFNHLIVARSSICVENATAVVLGDLQKKGIKLFGFTASSPGIIHPQLPPFHKVREAHLKELGIDFSINNEGAVDFFELKPTKGEYPCVKNGIIYSCGLNNTKGAVLKRFLSDYSDVSKVVFFDDKLKNIDSVAITIKTDFPSIDFFGFHYQGVMNLQCEDPGEQKVKECVLSLVEMIEPNQVSPSAGSHPSESE